jgi:hypothetical protein
VVVLILVVAASVKTLFSDAKETDDEMFGIIASSPNTENGAYPVLAREENLRSVPTFGLRD